MIVRLSPADVLGDTSAADYAFHGPIPERGDLLARGDVRVRVTGRVFDLDHADQMVLEVETV